VIGVTKYLCFLDLSAKRSTIDVDAVLHKSQNTLNPNGATSRLIV
jgi:hypothetical protein